MQQDTRDFLSGALSFTNCIHCCLRSFVERLQYNRERNPSVSKPRVRRPTIGRGASFVRRARRDRWSDPGRGQFWRSSISSRADITHCRRSRRDDRSPINCLRIHQQELFAKSNAVHANCLVPLGHHCSVDRSGPHAGLVSKHSKSVGPLLVHPGLEARERLSGWLYWLAIVSRQHAACMTLRRPSAPRVAGQEIRIIVDHREFSAHTLDS